MASLTPRLDDAVRNLIINGNFDLCQRGGTPSTASFSAVASGAYTFDRFKTSNGGSGTVNITGSTDVPTVAQSFFNSTTSMKITVATASPTLGSGDNYNQRYFVEGYDYANIHARKARLQFFAKVTGTSVTGTYSIALFNNAGNRVMTLAYQIPTAGVWTPITIDFALDTQGTWAFDNSRGLEIDFSYGAGSSQLNPVLNTWGSTLYSAAPAQVNLLSTTGNSLQISQVALFPQDFTQAGATNVVVPFQRAGRTFQQELAMAQRYYETTYGINVAPGTSTNVGASRGSASASSTSIDGIFLPFAVQKRAAPTMLGYGSTGTANIWNWNDQSVAGTGTASFVSGLAACQAGILSLSTGPTLGRAATVTGHWTADAEL